MAMMQSAGAGSRIKLDEARGAEMVRRLRVLFEDELDIGLSEFQAHAALEPLLRVIGPSIYNQAIHDARAFVQERLEDLDASLYEREEGE